ncbi:MAG: cupin domain-containing protein [Chloroflexi bacterium]|nr:MAG: cupin domain-containing protein [Chloroflexota bacterium]
MTSIATGFIDVLDGARIHLHASPDDYSRFVDAREVIERLALRPHPEGGWYAETWRADAELGARAAGSAIFFLLAAGERSHWHRVIDAAEVWLFHAGGALELRIQPRPGDPVAAITIGPELAAGQRPQAVVPAGAWQAARPLGAWTLVSCVVVPAFEFSSFELAPEGWEPR